MNDIHERAIQATHLKVLNESSALFKTLCTLLAGLAIAGAILATLIGAANGELGIALIAAVVVIQSMALIYFARLMKSLSAVLSAVFEMSLDEKQAKIRTESEQPSTDDAGQS